MNWAWGCLFIVFLLALASAFYVGQKAIVAEQALTRARADLTTFQQLVQGAPSAAKPSLADAASASVKDVDDAIDASRNPVWSAYEQVPVLGPNLRAIRETAEALRPLTVSGVQPLADAFGRGTQARAGLPLARMLPDRSLAAVQSLDTAVNAAAARVAQIDVDSPLPQFAHPVVQLRTELAAVAKTSASWGGGGTLLRRALGESGARQYLMVFARPDKPDLFMLIGLNRGRVASRIVSTSELGQKAPHSVSASSARRFPQVASALARSWRTTHKTVLDGVVLADADMLTTILQATGPLTISRGSVLSARTSLSALRADPARFAKVDLPVVLGALYSGRGNSVSFLAQLPSSATGGAIRMWATDSEVDRAVRAARLDGVPAPSR